ncbi:MAG: sigma-E processing peptidase SpoIIGA [Clostridia bacterium]|nr:sigma-E processing peptidase SpoIIGA [Clostridia bacterium]
MPVYVDVLLIVNGFVNYLMLFLSMKYLRFTAKRFRLLIACAMGSVFSLRIFLPDIPLLPEFLLRVAMCCAISFASFGFVNFKTFLRNTCVFLAVNLLFGGLMSAILFFFNTGMMLYRNGAVYFNIDLKILAVTSVASFAVVDAVSRIIERKAGKESICTVKIFCENKEASGRGFFDTGNGLREIFSSLPVIVAQYDAVKNVMPKEVAQYCKNEDIEAVSGNIRLIPVSGVGATELMPAFKPDRVLLKSLEREKEIKDVYIAVSRQSFFGGEFEFILNNEFTGDYDNEHTETNKAFAFKAHRQK